MARTGGGGGGGRGHSSATEGRGTQQRHSIQAIHFALLQSSPLCFATSFFILAVYLVFGDLHRCGHTSKSVCGSHKKGDDKER